MIQLRQISDADQIRLKTDKIPLALLEPEGARQGQVMQFDGTTWYPGVVILNTDGVILDLDGVELVDLDGDGIVEPGDLVVAATELAVITYVQQSPLDVWTIPHGFNRYPISTEVRDSSHRPMFPTIDFPDTNTARVRCAYAKAGEITLTFYLK